MKVLVLGGTGLLGEQIVRKAKEQGHEVSAPSRQELDLCSDNLNFADFDVLVNSAAYTNVDKAEQEQELAFILNAELPKKILNSVKKDQKIIHISTDYVFDGTKLSPYLPSDPVNPLNIYGKSKLAGEEALKNTAIVLRTSWLFGDNRQCLPVTVLKRAFQGLPVTMIDDQFGNPTHVNYLAQTITDCIDSNLLPGIYHAAGPDTVSWFDFVSRIFKKFNLYPPKAIKSEEWPSLAKRPLFSALDSTLLWSKKIQEVPSLDEQIEMFVGNWKD